METAIQNLFKENGGVLRTKQLKANGVHYRKLQKMINAREITQVKRGYYQLVDENSFSDVPVLVSLFPDGVFCMDSALQFYGYTEHTPSQWHIAVDEKTSRKRFHIEYPLVKPHFVTSGKFPIGIVKANMEGCEIKVYDRERTICDVLLHRNKFDAEVFNYAIQSYLKDDAKDITKLIPYAQKLRVEKKAREVIGVWLYYNDSNFAKPCLFRPRLCQIRAYNLLVAGNVRNIPGFMPNTFQERR